MAKRKSPNTRKKKKKKQNTKNQRIIKIFFLILVIILVGAYLSFKNWEKKQNTRLESGSQIAQTSMGIIEYVSLGEGPIILFSHMGGSGYDNVYLFEELVEKGFRIISPSRPGYLRTPLPENADFSYQADLFAELLQHLNINEKVFVLGYSSGGPAAIEFALRYPRKTKGLVLHSAITKAFPSPEDMNDNQKFLNIMLSDLWQDLLCWSYSISSQVFPKRMIGEILERGSTFDKNYCRVAATDLSEHEYTTRLLEKFEASTVPLSRRTDGLNNDLKYTANFKPELNRLRVPTLVTHSRVDKIVNVTHSENFKQEVPRAELFIYDGYGHSIFFGEDWKNLTQRTLDFFNTENKKPILSLDYSEVFKHTWVSKQDGALLKINDNHQFTLDFPSVDSKKFQTGVVEFEGNTIIFNFHDNASYCADSVAKYRFQIKNNELKLNALRDKCKRRKSHFNADWFLL